MRRFIAEALVDAASLVAIFFVLSLISVPQPFPFGADRAPILELTSGLAGVLVAAAFLVLAERFVRPVIIAFTGRLLLSTFGLFMVVVNALMIWVASLVAPDIARAAHPQLCGSSRSPPSIRSSPRWRAPCSACTAHRCSPPGGPRRSGGCSIRCRRRAAT